MTLPVPFTKSVDFPPASVDLDITCRISTPSGYLNLQDEAAGYELHPNTRSSGRETFHSTDLTSPYVAGTYSTGVQMDDVPETVSIWCIAKTTYGMMALENQLRDAFYQENYTMIWRIEDAVFQWDCRFATLARTTQQEYAHARMSLMEFTVPRKPAVSVYPVSPDDL